MVDDVRSMDELFVGRIGALAASNFRDRDGRPLGESRAPASARADVALAVKRCPYAGSRRGKPMNGSALAQVKKELPRAKALLARLRAFHLAKTGGPLDATALWHVGELAVALPAYLALRREAPVADGALDPAFAALAKAMAGVNLTLQHVALASLLPGAPEVFSPASLVSLAEAHGHLVGEAEVCAAPSALIEGVLEVLIDGGSEGAAGVPPMPDLAVVAPLAGAVVDFALAHVALTVAQRCAGAAPTSPLACRPIVQRLAAAIATGTIAEWAENLRTIASLGSRGPSLAAELDAAPSKEAWLSSAAPAFAAFFADNQAAALAALGHAPSRPRVDQALIRTPRPAGGTSSRSARSP